ncbi:MAG: hypothetical protein JXC32_10735 [Anaerolineae bacterium]|nr:hypothetical protein [Anaerolineae bacterium]
MRNDRLPGWTTALLILVLTAIGFVGWIGLQALLWGFLRVFGISTDLWAMVEALSTAVTVAALISGGYVAYRELDELSNSRYIDVSNKLFEELNSQANIEARRWVIQHLPNDPAEGLPALSSEGRHYVKRVLNSLDHIAFLTQSGWIPDELIMPWMNPMVVKVWAKLGPYVDYESNRRHEPDFYEHARKLAERCVAWRSRHVPDGEITWVDHAL